MTSNRPWTTAEERYLRKHVRSKSALEIGAELDRTENAIWCRIRKLGLADDRASREARRERGDYKGRSPAATKTSKSSDHEMALALDLLTNWPR